jgi:integrase
MAVPCHALEQRDGILRCSVTFRWTQKASPGRVPLTPTSKRLLQRRAGARTGSPFVFAHPDGGPIRSDYWEQFKRLLKLAGLSSVYRVHDLRHTFGMSLRRKGVPLESIMGLMRHADIKETMIYAKYSDEEGAQQIVKIEATVG